MFNTVWDLILRTWIIVWIDAMKWIIHPRDTTNYIIGGAYSQKFSFHPIDNKGLHKIKHTQEGNTSTGIFFQENQMDIHNEEMSTWY